MRLVSHILRTISRPCLPGSQIRSMTGGIMGAKKALVVIADGSEEIEAVTPIDVLRRAGVEVSVAGLAGTNPVVCSRNVVLVPDGSLSDLRTGTYDAIILPGGLKGADAFANSSDVGELLKDQEKAGRLICAICAAPVALKSHGIGIGKQLTSYPAVKDKVVGESTSYEYKEDRVVVDGDLITSRGPATSLEFSLAIVESLVGKEKAEEVGKGMLRI